MKRYRLLFFTLAAVIALSFYPSYCQPYKTLNTKYTKIHFEDKTIINEFVWRVGGKKLDAYVNTDMASSRIDRVIERVRDILDMHPRNFSVMIYIKRGPLSSGYIAHYDSRSKELHMSVDNATDGVFAHEIAHAIIDAYFITPPTDKMKEILCQYVDAHLWSDW